MPKILKDALNYILAGFILLIAFYAFSFFLVKGGGLARFDFDMTVRIQDNIPVRFDPYFSLLSLIGSFEGVLIMLGALLVLIRKIRGITIVGIFALMHVVEIVGKAYLDHPPTPFMFHRYSFDFVFPTGYVQPGGSYPSGHAMRTAFIAILVIYLLYKSKKVKPNIKYVSYVFIALFYLAMIISRVSLGEHWTSDVIGGSILGAAFALFSLVFI